MKKLYLVLLMWIFFSTNCFAMTFLQPVEIGKIDVNACDSRLDIDVHFSQNRTKFERLADFNYSR